MADDTTNQRKVLFQGLSDNISSSDEDGEILPIEEFAELNNLPFDKEKKTPKMETYGSKGQASSLGWEYDESTGEFYTAALVPDNIDTPVDYLDDDDVAAFLNPQNTNKSDEVKFARRLYKNEGVVTNSVNVQIDNAAIDRPFITNITDKNSPLKKLCKAWIKNINNYSEVDYGKKVTNKSLKNSAVRPIGGIESVFQQALQALLVDGDWVATEDWRQIEVPEAEGKFSIPAKVTTHNLDNLTFSEAAAELGLDVITYEIPSDIIDAVKASKGQATAEQKVLAENTPEWLRKLIKQGETKVPLPGEFTTHIKRKALDFDMNGASYIRPFFSPIADKIRLRNLDRSTVIGLIQRLTILMLGHDDYKSPYHKANVKRFKLFQGMVQNLKVMKFMLWGGPGDITALDIGPDNKILSLKEKYSEVDADILMAGGIPELLLNGSSSGTSARDFSAFVATVGKLEVLRRQLQQWADLKLREIAVENGFEDEFPKLNFRLISLRDEKSFKSLISKAFETSLLGRRRSLNEIGFDADEVVEEQLAEESENLNEQITPPSVAWGTNNQGGRTPNPTQDESPGRPPKGDDNAEATLSKEMIDYLSDDILQSMNSAVSDMFNQLEGRISVQMSELIDKVDKKEKKKGE